MTPIRLLGAVVVLTLLLLFSRVAAAAEVGEPGAPLVPLGGDLTWLSREDGTAIGVAMVAGLRGQHEVAIVEDRQGGWMQRRIALPPGVSLDRVVPLAAGDEVLVVGAGVDSAGPGYFAVSAGADTPTVERLYDRATTGTRDWTVYLGAVGICVMEVPYDGDRIVLMTPNTREGSVVFRLPDEEVGIRRLTRPQVHIRAVDADAPPWVSWFRDDAQRRRTLVLSVLAGETARPIAEVSAGFSDIGDHTSPPDRSFIGDGVGLDRRSLRATAILGDSLIVLSTEVERTRSILGDFRGRVRLIRVNLTSGDVASAIPVGPTSGVLHTSPTLLVGETSLFFGFDRIASSSATPTAVYRAMVPIVGLATTPADRFAAVNENAPAVRAVATARSVSLPVASAASRMLALRELPDGGGYEPISIASTPTASLQQRIAAGLNLPNDGDLRETLVVGSLALVPALLVALVGGLVVGTPSVLAGIALYALVERFLQPVAHRIRWTLIAILMVGVGLATRGLLSAAFVLRADFAIYAVLIASVTLLGTAIGASRFPRRLGEVASRLFLSSVVVVSAESYLWATVYLATPSAPSFL